MNHIDLLNNQLNQVSIRFTLILSLVLNFSITELISQDGWSTEGRYLTLDGNKTFFSGVNYVPSHGWLTHLENWDAQSVEMDFEMLRKAGVRNIRYLPLWPQLQKERSGAYLPNLLKLDTVINLAAKYDMSVQLGLLNSWMSGGTFLPSWGDGNIFTDPLLIEAEKNLIRDVVSRYRNNHTIQAYDIGNEVNVLDEWMNLHLSVDEAHSWMKEMYETSIQYDDSHQVINGVGTGYSNAFNIVSIGETSDMMASHSYPYFHGTSRFDPWLGQRTTYSTNYIISWAEMVGKPVIMQELGSSEQWMPARDIPKYMETTFISNWAEGAAGYLWWCSHDIDPDFKVSDDGLFKKYSTPRVRSENKFSALNYDMGILNHKNQLKPLSHTFKYCADLIDRLGLGWVDQLPICYILVPEDYDYGRSMIHLINSFVLAKQAHMDIKFLFEWNEIPEDASAVVISGFQLSELGKKNVGAYLKEGGTVYQSDFNDMIEDMEIAESSIEVEAPIVTVDERRGLFSLGERINLPFSVSVREVTQEGGAKKVLSLDDQLNVIKANREHDTDFFESRSGPGLMYEAKVGNGRYYYLSVDLERSLMSTYGDWQNNKAYLIYSALRGKAQYDLSNHEIELYHKSKGNREILVLINHSGELQQTVIYSDQPVSLHEITGDSTYKESSSFQTSLASGQARIFEISR